jgi:tRNA G46 methylase TrmB
MVRDCIRDFNKSNIPRPDWDGRINRGYHFLDIEIGCGVGFHPISYARKNPDRLLVAVEKTTKKFEKFKRRFLNHKSPANLIPVHANAVAWITHYIQPESVDRYFILYPNPYPKNPQKRFFAMPFMAYLIETLKPHGEITLATNEKFHADEARELGVQQWNLKLIKDEILPLDSTPRTHFEKKYLARGEACFNLKFLKS